MGKFIIDSKICTDDEQSKLLIKMGPRKGTWKGGTMGCSFNMLSGEHPTDTMLRMQREYTFS